MNKMEAAQEVEGIPKISESERFSLLGGDSELLSHYVSLRETVTKARQSGAECFCDPRDATLCHRLATRSWRPRVTLRGVADARDELTSGDTSLSSGSNITPAQETRGHTSSVGSYSSRQTALDLDGDISCKIEADSIDRDQNNVDVEKEKESFVCGVHGCNSEFTSLASYESHYHTSHNFVCHVCRRVFASNFLLDIHLEENHDSYFQILSPRVDMYRCLVESCSSKFRTSDIRKEHMISVHKFPAGFSFHKPLKSKSKSGKPSKAKLNKENIDASWPTITNGRDNSNMECSNSCNFAEPAATQASPSTSFKNGGKPRNSRVMDVDMVEEGQDKGDEMGDGPLAAQSSAQCGTRRGKNGRGKHGRGRGAHTRTARAPPTICFGRGSQRAFQNIRGKGRHWHQTQEKDKSTAVDIEKMDFADIADSLVDCI